MGGGMREEGKGGEEKRKEEGVKDGWGEGG